MADFTARITSGVDRKAWDVTGVPVNTPTARPHRHAFSDIGAVTEVIAKATVDGVEGEVDANLGGRLFLWWWAQWPSFPNTPVKSLPLITIGAGQSSVATISLFPNGDTDWFGHWVLACRREEGGIVYLPFDVEEP